MSVALRNPLASLEQLETTVSRRDGIDEELEQDLRNLGAELIQSAGILLKLPQVAMATAQVLFQRFYYMASLKEFGIMEIGMGALFLASKLEECFVRMTHLITVYDLLMRRIKHQSIKIPLDPFSQKAYNLKDMAIAAEMQILRKLGFIVHVQLPYNLMINYLRILDLEEHDRITRKAWNYLNDGLRTTIYVTHEPPTIACAAIWLACLEEGVKLPTTLGKEWWLLFDVDAVNFKNAAAHIKRLYFKKLDRANLPLYKLSQQEE
ncbi:cyclin-like protein [Gilbertella persicaria]|uniref:cyclin-like protein n=1 Tax=Gilbertella persicaria TaxID=101096 RepID=UPI00221E7D0A|nr:cyclin-like protein [Gilbertella persicaria]KAI8054180.1 cyclin-like protein [Gilbertella persicaria]